MKLRIYIDEDSMSQASKPAETMFNQLEFLSTWS